MKGTILSSSHYGPWSTDRTFVLVRAWLNPWLSHGFCSIKLPRVFVVAHAEIPVQQRIAQQYFTWENDSYKAQNNGQFQKISIPNHGRLACFNTPLPSEIPKCVTSPCPQNSMIVNPPSPSEFPFFWKYIFDLATPIWTNEHESMPPQGCDLAASGDKLYSSVTRKTYR